MSTALAKASVELLAPKDKVWPLLGSTEEVNRWMGQSPYKLTAVDATQRKTGARYAVEAKDGIFTMDHEALPFEWEEQRFLKAVRKMIGGPFESIVFIVRFEPGQAKNGTRVDVSLEVKTRSILLKPLAQIAANRYVKRYVELAKDVDSFVRRKAETPYKMTSPARLDVAQVVAKRLVASGTDEALAKKLSSFVTDAPDTDVIHMRPYELADQWELDRTAVLRAFLHSVQGGLTELRWSIICPSCRTASERVTALDQIALEGHCQLCDISFDLDLDRSVEATFLPHEAVRSVVAQQFCIGGPARTPHVISQANVDAGGSHAFTAPDQPARYRIFARGGASTSLSVEDDAEAKVDAVVEDGAVRPAEVHVKPGGTVTVKNATSETRHVKLERLGYASAAATAHEVSTLDEFRRFFSGDLLKRETPLKVSHVAILFSDLVGSTALYTHVGDAAAFRLVDDHFDLLRAIVVAHGGVVVKTMGDAILAAFTDEAKAAAAGAEAIEAFEKFRSKREHGDRVGIKLGMFAGACYVVTANGALDYFGQIVNVASRVQHLAGSGEILLPVDVYDNLGDELKARFTITERLEATVKGVAAPIPLVRLILSTSSRSADADRPLRA